MSRYNHFSAKAKYESIPFESLDVFDKFRMDKRDGKRRRSDIIMIKLSDLSYRELKSGKVYHPFSSKFDVYKYDKKITEPNP